MDIRLKERERWISVWNYVLSTELEADSKFLRTKEGQLYIVIGGTNEIMALPRAGRGGDPWHAYFTNTYGYGEREKLTKFVYDALRSYVIDNGIEVDLRRFAVFKQDTKTAYLSSYNGQIFKIEGPSKITLVQQGEDGVFFADDDKGVHVDPEIGPHGVLLDRLGSPNFAPNPPAGTTPEQQRRALIIWMFALAFPDLLPTKPLLLVEGPKGSGKTSVVTMIQLALMGHSSPDIVQRNKEDDFGVTLLRAPIALLDNQDTYVDWIADNLCAYATSGLWTRRKLYTDDEIVTIKPHAFVAISTRNPASYRRDDVVDRCIILRFERRREFMSAKALEDCLIADRAKLFGEYLWYVGRIVEELRAGTASPVAEVQRMADFAAFGRVVARVLGWPDEEFEGVLDALQAERDAFLNEEDPLVDLLRDWLKHRNGGKFSNVGRLVSMFDLHSALEGFASVKQLPWKESPRTLAQKLQSNHVEREFYIERHMLNGHKAFRIYRHGDARLSVVADTPELQIND